MAVAAILTVTLALPLTLALAAWWARGAGPHPAVRRRKLRRVVRIQVLAFGLIYAAAFAAAVAVASADEPAPHGTGGGQAAAAAGVASRGEGRSVGDGLAMLGVAVATGLAVLGAGFAVGPVGAAALGAISEKPEMFGRTLIFIGLAEGLAIYGLVVSVILLERLR